ncbi:hypothetical protein SAMN04488109_6819 [Chryseolinea serpens]|uniref:TIR domain-containing protein n=1 Tax=Chryseolinea serpens TaxID=947013 RepID=A0A1M5XPR9_9BACT|nr:TIR domain-containing protein [Chryseolinea serpens]SHI01811.1 hypothetical protein SAMN04488109_6819 [Chryseolinea serpens]
MARIVEFDIALSFAGEDRPFVDKVAHILKSKGISVFYDKFEEENLWGKNLYDYLSDVYRNKALYTVMFVSEHYNKKLWANHERQAMQSRAFQENQEYILPARFDNTEIPGMLPTIGYISLKGRTAEEFAEIICKKLVLSGRTIPSENIRKSLSPLTIVPKVSPSRVSVTVKNEKDEPITGASVLLLADNNTYLQGATDSAGKATFEISTRRNYKLYFAHDNYPAYIVEKIDPSNDLAITIHSSENIGSIICPHRQGHIPGFKGRLNPKLDAQDRTYLYADNIAVNGGKAQPVAFKVNEPLDLEDCDGLIVQITVRDIQGDSCLIEFVKPVVKEV